MSTNSNYFKNRKTIRKYQNKPVDETLVYDLLSQAMEAPTTGNMQLYSAIVSTDKDVIEKLAPCHFNQPMVTEAPVMLTFCADFHRTSVWCEQRKATPGYDNFLSFLNASIDTLLYAQTFCTLAEEKGLGICYLGTTIYQPDVLIDTLKLPQLVMPVATVTVGYPDEHPDQPDRLPMEAFIHDEIYHDYTPADIDRLYAYKESLPENKHFVEINHTETLAQIFTDIRYTKKDNEAMSATYLAALKRQGFLK